MDHDEKDIELQGLGSKSPQDKRSKKSKKDKKDRPSEVEIDAKKTESEPLTVS